MATKNRGGIAAHFLCKAVRLVKDYIGARARKRWCKSEARWRGVWEQTWVSRTDGYYAVNLYPIWAVRVTNMSTDASYSWHSFTTADEARRRSFEAVEIVRAYESSAGIVD